MRNGGKDEIKEKRRTKEAWGWKKQSWKELNFRMNGKEKRDMSLYGNFDFYIKLSKFCIMKEKRMKCFLSDKNCMWKENVRGKRV